MRACWALQRREMMMMMCIDHVYLVQKLVRSDDDRDR